MMLILDIEGIAAEGGGKVLSSAEAATHLSVLLGNGLEAREAMF